jgi:hypothetical protein
MKCFALDAHFWVSLVGSVCDRGRGTRANLVRELERHSSLDLAEAGEVVDTMIARRKLVEDEGVYRCTIPS